jgi:hypothetical protein
MGDVINSARLGSAQLSGVAAAKYLKIVISRSAYSSVLSRRNDSSMTQIEREAAMKNVSKRTAWRLSSRLSEKWGEKLS